MTRDQSTIVEDRWGGAPPQVSIIIPAFNAEDYIEAAVRSAQAQTLSDLEIIVVDDASTDRTSEIVRGLASADARIRLARMDVNGGPGVSRNRGLEMARGAWVALLDADDRFQPERLEVLIALAQRESADVAADNVALYRGLQDTGQRSIPQTRLSAPRPLPFDEFVEGCIYDPAKHPRAYYVFLHPIISHDFLRRHRIQYDGINRNGEDFLFFVECFLAGAKWCITPEPMYLYAVRDGSMTEVQSREDFRRIVYRMRDLARDSRVLKNKPLADAIRRYWKLNASAYYYFSFKDAVRAANPKRILATLFGDRVSAGFIARELFVKTPSICRKLVRRYV